MRIMQGPASDFRIFDKLEEVASLDLAPGERQITNTHILHPLQTHLVS